MMDKMTNASMNDSSPYVLNTHGLCGNSVVTEYAQDGDLFSVYGKKHTPRELLQIGHDISASVADLHYFDEKGRATIGHTDLKPDNWLLINGKYKVNDFNRCRFWNWNKTADEPCYFVHSRNKGYVSICAFLMFFVFRCTKETHLILIRTVYPPKQWRAPEEYRYEPHAEKIDVYSLGMTLHYLLVPFNKYWPPGVEEDEWIKRVSENEGPAMPDTIRNSTNAYTLAMVKAIDLALEPDPIKRPSAIEVTNVLKDALVVEMENNENDGS